MEYSSAPPPRQPTTPPPSPPPPQQQQHHDTTLTLALALSPPPLPYTLISPKQQAQRPRPEGAAVALTRVLSSPIGDTPPCTECGKLFLSWKALFGHMCCHPERQWRGITPPPHFRHWGGASAAASDSQFSVHIGLPTTSSKTSTPSPPNLPGRSNAMEYSSAPPPRQPTTPPPSPPPPQQQQHHDTTLTLALALSPPPLPYTLISPKQQARRPRPEGAAVTLARVLSSPIGDTPPCTECGKLFPSWKALFGHMRCHPERQWRGITPPLHFRFRHGGGASAAASARQFSVQEREAATTLLLLAGARPGTGKGKKSLAAATLSANESCGTSASAAPGQARCDDHKCSVCERRFARWLALGGHKRCHRERTCAEVVVIANPGSSGSAMSEVAATAKATMLDLNLMPPGGDQGSMNEMLDLKLGY